jgi:hypothetical protein
MTRLINVLIVMGVVAVVIALTLGTVSVYVLKLDPSFIYIPLGVFAVCGACITIILLIKLIFNIKE